MSGLLTKEFLYLKAQKRVIYTLLVIAIVLFCTMGGTELFSGSSTAEAMRASFFGVLMAMFAATEVFSTLGCDEKAKWNSYACSLPVTAAQAVGAKYLFLLLLTVAGMALGVLIELFMTGGHPTAETLKILCAVTGGVSILMCSIELPLYYRFGLQKSNLIVIVLFCLLPIAISQFGANLIPGDITDAQFFNALRLFPVVLLAVMLLSFFLSVWIYARKEQ
jgi:ABC-2 type transport system permease protein